jgi:hypothetical protein
METGQTELGESPGLLIQLPNGRQSNRPDVVGGDEIDAVCRVAAAPDPSSPEPAFHFRHPIVKSGAFSGTCIA